MSNVMSYLLATTFVTSGLMAAHGQAQDKATAEYNARVAAKLESAKIKHHAKAILADSNEIADRALKSRLPSEICEMFNLEETRKAPSILRAAYEMSVQQEGERAEATVRRVEDFGRIADIIQKNIEAVNFRCSVTPGAPTIAM